MQERKQAATGIDDRRARAPAPVTWNDYRVAQARRIEYLVRLRTEQIRRRAERRKKPDA
jgi:hypothetical protein